MAYCVAGKVNSADKLYLVIESVRPDTKHARHSNAPVPADGAGGSRMADYRRLAQHDSVPHALPIGAAGSHSCVSAAKPVLPMASKPAKLLLF